MVERVRLNEPRRTKKATRTYQLSDVFLRVLDEARFGTSETKMYAGLLARAIADASDTPQFAECLRSISRLPEFSHLPRPLREVLSARGDE